jgi:NAD(P)H-hydrate epimerase
MWIATADRRREIDRLCTEEFGVPAMVLMERAGLAVFDAVRKMLPEGGRVTIFCGKGSNGGDGLVVARHLHAAHYGVEVLVASEEGELNQESQTQLAVSRAQGVQPIFFDDARWERKAECVGCRDLIVDALLGTGSRGEVRGPVQAAIRAINRSGVPVISVDIPSGIDTDTGEDMGESVWALRTVTFGLPKPYLFQGIGLEHAGYWSVESIGMPSALLHEPTNARLIDQEFVANLIPDRLKASHKGENGRILIVAGSRSMPGAAILACKGALRTGAGLVTLAGIGSVCDAVAAQLPEVTFLRLPDDGEGIAADAWSLFSDAPHRWDSALFGPGLGQSPAVREFLSRLWANWQLPSCIDADALNAVSQGVHLPPAECVLTPHPGEMSRLLNATIAEVQANRFESVRSAVNKLGKTVVLKGPYSVIGEALQPLAVNSTGNPGMASGGMGDVLGGVLATLLAQDLPPYLAAACGTYWHGLAGDLCAAKIGNVGFRASEVAVSLPSARAKITACEPTIDVSVRPSLPVF